MEDSNRYQALLELEENIRMAILGQDEETRADLELLHNRVVNEIRSIRGQSATV